MIFVSKVRRWRDRVPWSAWEHKEKLIEVEPRNQEEELCGHAGDMESGQVMQDPAKIIDIQLFTKL